jgi:quercetin dioxygenase-like cupin family protein
MSIHKKVALGASLAVVCMAAVLVDPVAAQATPPSKVSATLIFDVRLGGTEYVAREVTIQPGGETGWHYHDGPVYGQVKSGTLTHLEADCTVVAYGPGQLIVEPSGKDKVHIGRNTGNVPVVLDVLYVLPVGKPLSEDAADPHCP